MPPVESELALLRNPRLAALATGALPAWLWSVDASRMVWANASGAMLFGAANVIEAAERRFDNNNPAAAQVARLAATLPSSGAPRLERLRGFGAGFGRVLTCGCSRITLADGSAAVLVVAAEPVGPALPLAERVRRLFPDNDQPVAVFAPDGALIHATAAARARLGEKLTLPALGLEPLAATALASGNATGTMRNSQDASDVTLDRLGENAGRVLVLTLPALSKEAIAAANISDTTVTAAAPAEPPAVPVSSQTVRTDEPVTERRHPLRFVWQMDADGRFVVGSDEFIELIGPRTMAAFGRNWNDIAGELELDPDNQIARAVATHETWSGVVISWPLDETSERLPVELSGLPVFDRDRSFRGYRGFGVCRDIGRINQLLRTRRERPIGFMPAPEVPQSAEFAADPIPAPQTFAATESPAAEPATRPERPVLSVAAASANVVPFRSTPVEPKAPTLSPVERKAFRELAQELTARLRGTPDAPAVPENSIDGALAEAPHPPSEATEAKPSPSASAASGTAPAGTAVAEAPGPGIDPSLLDRLPIGVLVYRHDALLYANRHFLALTGHETLDALVAAGGLSTLFVEPGAGVPAESGGAQSLSIMTRRGDTLPVDGRLFTAPWNGASALVLVLTNGPAAERRRTAELALAAAESELRDAKRETQKAAAAKAEFLAKVSHEIRTPLNSITGFAEVIMTERFGPIGNERYAEYLKDIHAAGTQLVSLLNDLLDLSKIETGQLNLTFANVSLNDLTQQCVGIMQPQANRARIIIRSSLTPALPQIVADERSLRQIVINLLANSIKFTGPGGQVIVSTAFSDTGEVVLRVRDTGVGMSEKDIEAALEPFRQAATSGSWGSGGTGLGLPLTKALAEANRANFSIKSAPNAGTLVEVAFPHSRVAAN
jgi:signal transduction histidine kinase